MLACLSDLQVQEAIARVRRSAFDMASDLGAWFYHSNWPFTGYVGLENEPVDILILCL